MFASFRKLMQQHFALLLAQVQTLYMTDVDRDKLWEEYLALFPENVRQEYNCNACKSFIRHYGGIVFIIAGEMKTIWDFKCEEPYQTVVEGLNDMVMEAGIANVFYPQERMLGRDHDHEKQPDGTITKWDHMSYALPSTRVIASQESIDTLMGIARDNRNVFKRGLDEISIEAIDTVLDLIEQNSLYRGAESKGVLTAFGALKIAYDDAANKELWAWDLAPKHAGALATIRNSAIGTLLINISEGMELDAAVGKFEAIMAPTNYKRPNAIITQKMIQEAEETIQRLGYADSLARRFATADDLTVNNLLFVDRNLKGSQGLLSDLKETAGVNAKAYLHVEELSMENFIEKVVPTLTGIELLFEGRHEAHLMSLIAPVTPHAQSMFKWPNSFSWSYKNAIADSMKEKVKAAGGRIEGELRISLEWYNTDDLDLHVYEPGGHEIYFRDRISSTGGQLDVDANAHTTTRTPVENIIWPLASRMKEGTYRVVVNQFNKRERIDDGFALEIECQGETMQFSYPHAIGTTNNVEVATFTYTRAKGMVFVKSMDYSSKTSTKTVWGVDTNKFHPVSMIMQSPNFWDGSRIGNAHLFFIIDKAHNDEQARGYFNEFLSPELEVHKRVFEALGSRSKVAPAPRQLSGLGFSSTQHSDLIVRVTGTFTRALKIKF